MSVSYKQKMSHFQLQLTFFFIDVDRIAAAASPSSDPIATAPASALPADPTPAAIPAVATAAPSLRSRAELAFLIEAAMFNKLGQNSKSTAYKQVSLPRILPASPHPLRRCFLSLPPAVTASPKLRIIHVVPSFSHRAETCRAQGQARQGGCVEP